MNVTINKRKLAYVPWVALIAFVFIFVGIIVWATGTNTALSNTNDALTALSVEAGDYVQTIHSAAVGAVVVCALMAALMVAMSGGRTCLEKAVDQRGKPVCGSWLWLATEAVLCTVWWLILFWLVFVIFGSCLWYGAAYTVQGVLSNTLVVARQAADAKANASSPPPMPGSPSVSPSPPGSTLASLSPPPPLNPSLTCDAGCLNLALFDFLVGVDRCVCDMAQLQSAQSHTSKAYKALGSVVAGSFLMWVGASFLLMNAVADFAKTKRERELLLRAQRQAADNAAAQLALGTTPATMYTPYTNDTLPLLQKQALQQQQMLQQQQQLQMMQMMANAANVRPAAPAPAAGATGGSANMGSAV